MRRNLTVPFSGITLEAVFTNNYAFTEALSFTFRIAMYENDREK